MNKHYTSLSLSKKLKENGCKLETYKKWSGGFINSIVDKYKYEKIPAYDILWDICIKYPKEFFGCEAIIEDFILAEVIKLVYKNKKQEAEDYIWDSCLFNPKNKEKE